jgi:hypothetical protein
MYTAVVAASQTIRDFLTVRLRADTNLKPFFDPGSGGTMVVTLSTPEEVEDQNQEGLSLWLYRVVRDEDQLNAPPQRIGPRQFRRTPLPVRLHYLVTPMVLDNFGAGTEMEQIILGKVLHSLYDHASFRGPDLHGDLTGKTDVELFMRLEPMTLEEITRVWNALKRSYQLSVSYEVSVVTLDSDQVDDVVPVESALPREGVNVGQG